MPASLLDILMILSLGLLGGTGTGLVIGFLAGRQDTWERMRAKDLLVNTMLVLLFSAAIAALLAWYIFVFAGRS